MVEITLKDNFGKNYEIEALERTEVEKKIEELNSDEVVELAYKNWISGTCGGAVALNIETGNLIGFQSFQNSGLIQDAHLIKIYEIEQNMEISNNDLYNNDDYDEQGNLKENLDVSERELECLKEWFAEEIHSIDFENAIKKQLDEIYDKD